MKILCTTSNFNELDDITRHFELVLNPWKRKLSEDEVADLIEKHNPVGILAGVEPLTRQVMEKGTRLRVISRVGIGLDSVDIAAAKALGITVTNTPDAPTIPVAELTIGLILSLLRKIMDSDLSIRRQEWIRPMGNLLYGKTVGIIGCGRIGSYLANLLHAFGCHVIGYDPYIQNTGVLKLVSLHELFSTSDIITLHLPYNPDLHHFISEQELLLMKNNAILINSSRGGLVDEAALYEYLNAGKLGGAGIDCFDHEPYTGPLASLRNVILTAHIGSYAHEARKIQEKQAVENLMNELRHSFL